MSDICERTMKLTRRTSLIAVVASALASSGCDRGGEPAERDHASDGAQERESAAAPTNRVDIPQVVRQNLGITFARVESRNVARTLRVPGRFELLPTARREYRMPLPGRVELLVEQYERVERGTPLYRVESAAWRDLGERIAAARALVESMGPLREAHAQHERSLSDKVAIWEERLAQLRELREAGGGSAAQMTEARATLNTTQAELADVMERDAELAAEQKRAEAELRSLAARMEILERGNGCEGGEVGGEDGGGFTVCAVAPGVVEGLGITPGGLAEENGLVLTVVRPEEIRFRARGLQSDLGRLRDGLAARVVAPQGGSVPIEETMEGELRIGLAADADERTIDLVVTPESPAPWARAGVSAHLEITLEGGREELAIPLAAVVRDGTTAVVFRRDPRDPDRVIRMAADLGIDDGRWVVIASGVAEGDEIVVGGNYQLMLATSGTATGGGHFHSDGTFHEGDE